MAGIFFKLIFKSLAPVLILVGVMSYMMSMQGQDPLAPLKHVASGIGHDVGQSTDAVARAASEASGYFSGDAPSSQRIYRWVDKQGVTHFGTEKPVDAVAFSEVDVDPNANVMQAYRPARTAAPTAPVQARTGAPGATAMPGMTANPLQVREMLDQVNATAQERLNTLEAIR